MAMMSEPMNVRSRGEAVTKRMIQARKWAGLSQGQAAKLVGLAGASSFQNYESGRTDWTLHLLLQLCNLYDADLTWVLTGVNPYFDPQHVIEAIEKAGIANGDVARLLEQVASISWEAPAPSADDDGGGL